jgi:hypothetical protein
MSAPSLLVILALEEPVRVVTSWDNAEGARLFDWLHRSEKFSELLKLVLDLVEDDEGEGEPLLAVLRRARRRADLIRILLARGDFGRARRVANLLRRELDEAARLFGDEEQAA